MSRHESAGSKTITFFQTCSKEVFLEFEGLVRRIKRERGFSAARKSRVVQESGKSDIVTVIALQGAPADLSKTEDSRRFRTDGVDKAPVKVAPIKGGQPDVTV